MKEIKFNSQICTSREQSERLLALGLKKETADMFWWDIGDGPCVVISRPAEKEDREYGKVIPAWSLHRLLCMIPNILRAEKPFENSFSSLMNIMISTLGIAYYYEDYDENRIYEFECFENLMEASVSAIEWLIKEGYFNKEYLQEQADNRREE